jgi:hypothetical protein
VTTQWSYYSKNDPSETHSTDGLAIAQDYSMTFSPTGFVALLCKDGSGGKEYIEPEPVLRWGTADEPIIFWDNHMVDATTLEEFRGLRKGRKVAGVVPGGGWSVTAEELDSQDLPKGPDGLAAVPVVAWIITEMGTAVPVVPSPHPAWRFRAEPADENIHSDSPARLIPPTS